MVCVFNAAAGCRVPSPAQKMCVSVFMGGRGWQGQGCSTESHKQSSGPEAHHLSIRCLSAFGLGVSPTVCRPRPTMKTAHRVVFRVTEQVPGVPPGGRFHSGSRSVTATRPSLPTAPLQGLSPVCDALHPHRRPTVQDIDEDAVHVQMNQVGGTERRPQWQRSTS